MSRFAFVSALVLAAACSADVLAPAVSAATAHGSAMTLAHACAATRVDTRDLLPDEATIIVGIDVAALRRSAWFSDLEAVARAHPDVARALAPVERCGITLASQREIAVALSEHDDAVLVVRADGLGKPATLDCIARELKKTIGVSPWTRRTTGCASVLEVTGGEGQGFSLDEDTVVIASRGWKTRVADRLAGKGASAMTGKLAWAWTRVDVSRTVWFAADVPASAAKGLGPKGAALRHVGGSVDAPAGLHVEVTSGFVDAADAAAAAKEIETQLGQLRLAAPMFGIPSGVADGVSVIAHGTRLDLTAKISEDDLRTLRELLAGPSAAAAPASPAPGSSPRI